MKSTSGLERTSRFCSVIVLAIAILSLAITAPGAIAQPSDDFYGTYRLIKTERKVLETGETETLPAENGFITYGRDGRMLVFITRGQRPKPESVVNRPGFAGGSNS